MKFLVITKDPEVETAAKEGFHPTDETIVFEDWHQALEACEGVDMLFVDLLATAQNRGLRSICLRENGAPHGQGRPPSSDFAAG